jgi:hypothetical protein
MTTAVASPVASGSVKTLEADADDLMRRVMPDGYHKMIEARRRLAGPRAETLAPPPSDDDIEATLARLIGETSAAATKAFALARQEAYPGGSAEVYGICLSQGSRAAAACASLVEALARRKGKLEQRIVLEYRHVHVVARPDAE